MAVAAEMLGDIQIVFLGDRIDSGNAVDAETRVDHAIAGKPKVLLDLEDLAYISSAGLRVVLLAAKKLKAGQGRLAVCGMSANIRQIFEMSGFLSLMPVFPDRAAALEMLRS